MPAELCCKLSSQWSHIALQRRYRQGSNVNSIEVQGKFDQRNSFVCSSKGKT